MNDKNNILEIDGHKPICCMTDEERDEYFMREHGLTYKEFYEKYPPITEVDFSNAKFIE